ncbi:hypothetical protein QR680_005584 [Steinernema hermaphroditum]|uniref:Phosphofurin acidic cluster sorting protein 2 n=1 Tax=Steinernema hermaphroditum TaxID=289476 RepID=A0AA39HSK6_9BILA|nr:hypothetical protein QR680_005584 [Steinernema hermaphroditum]
MAESSRIVPMRLYANWESDRASSSTVQRVFSMSLNRLVLFSVNEPLTSLVVTVKLQGYKRTLRSNDFPVPSSDQVDVALNISFTILLQRRKKYKTRPIPGFKTLAVGCISLTEVLQYGYVREIQLWSPEVAEKEDAAQNVKAIGCLFVSNCCTQAVDSDHETIFRRVANAGADAKQTDLLVSDDEEMDSSNDDGDSDVDQQGLSARSSQRTKHRMHNSRKAARQKNLKQKFVSLLRKFKVPEDDESVTTSHKGMVAPTAEELEELFEELDNLSDSGPDLEIDKLSIVSVPRPGLRPYFGATASREVLPPISDHIGSEDSKDSDEHEAASSEADNAVLIESAPSSDLSRRLLRAGHSLPSSSAEASSIPHSSTVGSISTAHRGPLHMARNLASMCDGKPGVNSARTVSVSEQLATILRSGDDLATSPPIPSSESIWLCSSSDFSWVAPLVANNFSGLRVIDCLTLSDVKTVISAVVLKIQKFCNFNSSPPPLSVLGVCGSDRHVSLVLRAYVDALLDNKSSQDWLSYLRFTVVAPPHSLIGRYLSTCVAAGYTCLSDSHWRNLFERQTTTELTSAVLKEIGEKLKAATSTAVPTSHLSPFNMPIGETMLQLADGVVDERDNTQVFVPFLTEVRVGPILTSEEENDSVQSSPRQANCNFDEFPSCAHHINPSTSVQAFTNASGSPPNSPLSLNKPADGKELQVEYWTTGVGDFPSTTSSSAVSGNQPATPQKKDSTVTAGTKWSMKASFRQLSVTRRTLSPLLSLSFSKHQKRKDKMLHKLGMKNRQRADQADTSLNQSIPNVTRMICSGKHSNLKVVIDGTIWSGVKFFQTSSQWQTHVKHFPICLQVSLPPRSHES